MPDLEGGADPSADIRADLGAALDKLEPSGGEPTGAVEPVEPRTQEIRPADSSVDRRTAAEHARDEQGRFAKGQGKEATPAAQKTPPAGLASPPPPAGTSSPGAPKWKPPQSWKPEERAKWDALPPEVQGAVSRREREASVAMQRAAETEKAHNQFRQAVQPFEQSIRARGGQVLPTVANLLQTAEALYSAPPPMKAQLIARMIQNFGVPIEALADALNGTPAPNGAQHTQQEFRDPRLDQYIQQQQQRDQERVHSIHQHYDSQLEEWASDKPHYSEVAELGDEMADLMEAAGKRGRKMTFDDAYQTAIQLYHPDIHALESQRAEAERARTSNEATERLRNAGSSVRNEPAGAANGGPAPGEDMRSDVMAAFRKVEGRR